MHLRHTLAGLAAIAGVAVMPAVAADNATAVSGQTSITLSGYVPVICNTRLSADRVPAQEGSVNLGSLREFCNNPAGYSVHVDFSDNLAGGKLLVDGAEITLTESGTAIVTQSEKAAIITKDIALSLPEDQQSGSLSFRIEPY